MKRYRADHGEPDVVEVRNVFVDNKKALAWERKVLIRLRIWKSERWLNLAVSGWCDRTGVPHTEEYKQRMSRMKKGRPVSDETRKKMSETRKKGEFHLQMFTPEANEKRRKSLRGRKIPKEVCEKIASAHRGKKHSPERCANISAGKRKSGKRCKGKTITINGIVYESRVQASENLKIPLTSFYRMIKSGKLVVT